MRDRKTSHAPIDQFATASGELLVGGRPLTTLAARVGRTPFYAYDRNLLNQRVQELRDTLPNEIKLHYAMKANPMPALVQHMVGLVDGIDVASAGELKTALDAGADPQEISFAGPGKTASELRQSVAAGIVVNVESFRELEPLARAAEELGVAAQVSVRVNPQFELRSSGMKMGGGAKQFGVDAELVPEILAEIGKTRGLSFQGFHIFSGSQNLSGAAIVEAQRKSFDLALELAEHAPEDVKTLNLGGGFGIPYFPGERRLEFPEISDNLKTISMECAARLPKASIVLELGRYLVGEAGIYVCKVLDRKISRDQVFLVTDGGLHQHLAASGNFGQVLRKDYPIAIGNRMDAEPDEEAMVVGPLCTPLDLLGNNVRLARAEVGDLVVVFQSGAYGATASPQDFLGHQHVIEVLV